MVPSLSCRLVLWIFAVQALAFPESPSSPTTNGGGHRNQPQGQCVVLMGRDIPLVEFSLLVPNQSQFKQDLVNDMDALVQKYGKNWDDKGQISTGPNGDMWVVRAKEIDDDGDEIFRPTQEATSQRRRRRRRRRHRRWFFSPSHKRLNMRVDARVFGQTNYDAFRSDDNTKARAELCQNISSAILALVADKNDNNATRSAESLKWTAKPARVVPQHVDFHFQLQLTNPNSSEPIPDPLPADFSPSPSKYCQHKMDQQYSGEFAARFIMEQAMDRVRTTNAKDSTTNPTVSSRVCWDNHAKRNSTTVTMYIDDGIESMTRKQLLQYRLIIKEELLQVAKQHSDWTTIQFPRFFWRRLTPRYPVQLRFRMELLNNGDNATTMVPPEALPPPDLFRLEDPEQERMDTALNKAVEYVCHQAQKELRAAGFPTYGSSRYTSKGQLGNRDGRIIVSGQFKHRSGRASSNHFSREEAIQLTKIAMERAAAKHTWFQMQFKE